MSAEKPPVSPSEPKPESAPETDKEALGTTGVASQNPAETPITEEQRARFKAASESLEKIKDRLDARKAEAETVKGHEGVESGVEKAEESIETPKNSSEKPKITAKLKESHSENKGDTHEKGKGSHGDSHGHKKEAFKPFGLRDWITAGAASGGMLVGAGLYEGLIAPSVINFLGLGPAVTQSLATVGFGAGFFGIGSALGLYVLWNFGKELWAERNNILKDIPLVGGLAGGGGGGGKKAAPKKAPSGGGGHDHH